MFHLYLNLSLWRLEPLKNTDSRLPRPDCSCPVKRLRPCTFVKYTKLPRFFLFFMRRSIQKQQKLDQQIGISFAFFDPGSRFFATFLLAYNLFGTTTKLVRILIKDGAELMMR